MPLFFNKIVLFGSYTQSLSRYTSRVQIVCVFLGMNQFLMISFTVKIVSEHIMTLPCCLVMTTFQVVFSQRT